MRELGGYIAACYRTEINYRCFRFYFNIYLILSIYFIPSDIDVSGN